MWRSAGLLTAMALAGCAGFRESRFNPAGWFGDDSSGPGERRVASAPAPADTELRPRVAEVASMTVTAKPGGAILTATGLAPRLGFWNAELVPRAEGRPIDGALVFDFRVAPPTEPTPRGAEPARLVTAARALSRQTLAGVNRIVVVGRTNQRVSTRQ